MKYKDKIVKAKFIKRENRFIGKVLWKGEELIVHIPNTGSLKGVLEKTPQDCRICLVSGTKRKIPWSLEMLKTQGTWVGVNTHKTNNLVAEAWEKGLCFQKYPYSQGEVKISSASRIDRVFWKNKISEKIQPELFKVYKFHFVEIKNVTLAISSKALFPDSPSERGRKHLQELKKLLKQGHTCEMVYVVQREDCSTFAPADTIDPLYGKEFRSCLKAGLKVSVFPCKMGSNSIELDPKHPLKLKI